MCSFLEHQNSVKKCSEKKIRKKERDGGEAWPALFLFVCADGIRESSSLATAFS